MSIFSSIGKFLSKLHIGDFIKKWFEGDYTDAMKRIGAATVVVLEKLKNSSLLLSSVADAIPGDLDNKIVDAFNAAVPKVLQKAMQGNTCMQKPTLMESIACFEEMVSGKEIGERTKIWNGVALDIASEVWDEVMGKKIDLNKFIVIITTSYVQLFGKK